jgi:multicomponent Na+:H+ antiporter subunit D
MMAGVEMNNLMPATLLLLGALILPLTPRAVRSALFLVFPLAAFALLSRLESGTTVTWPFLMYDLVVSRVDGLSLAFAYVFTLLAFLGGLYSFHIKDLGQQVFTLLYAGAALGVVFAGDWLTLYVFWEIMAISSVWLIWSARDLRSSRAGMRYLLMHLFGGMVLLAGILWHIDQTGSLLFNSLQPGGAATLILFGFALNAAIPPLHTWLVDAYPEATITGSVFLSAFTTKTAVYVLARGFAGWEILVLAGTVMALYGVVFAFLENDIRRILAYHIVSQVGYMVAGVGLGTEVAVSGATAHAFAHILYKGLLFMAVGAVIYATGRRKLTDLGGLASGLPWVLVFYMVGALSISGFPLLSGFVSKALVIHAAELDHRSCAVLLLHAASVGTFLSVGLKLPYFTWFGTKRSLRLNVVPPGMYVAMACASLINFIIGLAPEVLYRVLPFAVEYRPYTATHLLETIELLTFSGLAFWFLRGRLHGKATLTLDFDWFYRATAPLVRRLLILRLNQGFAFVEGAALGAARLVSRVSINPFAVGLNPRAYDPDDDRSPVGVILLIVIMCFVVFLGWDYILAD